MSAVYRWRLAFQADFQARLDWCMKDGDRHPPIARIKGNLTRTVESGTKLVLDASDSRGTGGRPITFDWRQYREAGSYPRDVAIENPGAAEIRLLAPTVLKSETIHIILTVTDNGSPPLRAYKRVIVNVRPARRKP
jgi:hypothetical protein